MGQTASLPFWRKACWGFFSPWKIQRLRPGFNPRIWVPKASTLSLDHRNRVFRLWTTLTRPENQDTYKATPYFHERNRKSSSFYNVWVYDQCIKGKFPNIDLLRAPNLSEKFSRFPNNPASPFRSHTSRLLVSVLRSVSKSNTNILSLNTNW